ncbi:CesT family type III secretion system chaperone [Chromobacterium violaceum]|uniref:CesT family type III secretion system chaperone n=1 Tax=Chromobacterium violaceum TaxID=536 RepID=UPI001B332D0E|nr:CesT family type III secretion system chaperone [Chromobacterium violaceum]
MNLLLSAFAKQIGVSDLKFDATGVCQLRIDGLRVALYDNPELCCLTLLAELPMPTLDVFQRDAWIRFVLTRQFDTLHEQVPIVGLNPQTDSLVALRHLPSTNLSLERLTDAVAGLVDWLAAWSRESSSLPFESPVFAVRHDTLHSTHQL